jgi:CHAD domain-containing protein
MAVASELETELKYEAGAEPPSLGDLPGVSGVEGPESVRLSAVYFDTADLRLARHGATLRRRTGGADEGWHLKVPVGGDSRIELRLPLDDGPATNAPPEELAELTLGMVRGAEIRPIALLRTKRRTWRLTGPGGSFVAEVAEDRVTARRLDGSSTDDKWRELEVELADPAAGPALDQALRKAGLRRSRHSSKLARLMPVPSARVPAGDTAGDALLGYLRTQYDEIVRQDLRVRRDEPDSVHQMRVAARRLRSALRAYRRLLPGTSRLRDDLRWLGRQLAQARDLEVQEEHLRSVIAGLPDDLVVGPVAARLTRHFGPVRAAASQTALKALRDKRYRRLLDSVDRLLADPPLTSRASRPAAAELPKHVDRAYRRTKRRVASETMHEVRKATKGYRYALEVAEPSVGKKARKARKAAKDLTKVLGTHQDGVVTRPVLRELGMRAQLAGENGFTFGLLHERERGRCVEAERVYPRHWKRVRGSRLKK